MRRPGLIALASTMASAAVLGAMLASPVLAESTSVKLAPGPDAPEASGQATFQLEEGVLKGSITAEDLPAQAYGSGRFVVGWFVRTDTGEKAFLGPLVHGNSIVLAGGGSATVNFAATHFTTGCSANCAIQFGPKGNNLIVVLIENNINGLTPSPVGIALAGTF